MGEFLFYQWLDENVTDLQDALLRNGLEGLFIDFEQWLEANGHLLRH